jgi:nucleotide-binding universal stress UspA family protein
MTQIKKIAVAVDFSEVSVKALKTAMGLADELNSELVVVHCAPIYAVALPEDGHVKVNEKVLDREMTKAREQLSALVSEVHAGTIKLSQEVVWGEPTAELNRYVADNAVDIVVIGTHGRTGLRHLFLGSVAESVLRHANVPVICIRSG